MRRIICAASCVHILAVQSISEGEDIFHDDGHLSLLQLHRITTPKQEHDSHVLAVINAPGQKDGQSDIDDLIEFFDEDESEVGVPQMPAAYKDLKDAIALPGVLIIAAVVTILAMCFAGIENDVACAVAGICAAPCSVALHWWMLGYSHRRPPLWGVIIGGCLFCLRQILWSPSWPIHACHHAVQFRGSVLGCMGLVTTAQLYVVWLAGPSNLLVDEFWWPRVLSCIHQIAVFTWVFNSLYLAVALQHGTRLVAGLAQFSLVALVLALGFLTPDRKPFTVQPMWPSELDHCGAVCSIVVAMLVLRLPPLKVTACSELPEEASGEASSTGFRFYFERLQQACATLSSMYLVALFVRSWPHDVKRGLYHESWAYLRLCYVALYGCYWLKRLPFALLAQSIACGTGFVFFLVLCRLTETPGSFRNRNVFNHEGLPAVSQWGHAAHRTESVVFYASFVMCYVHSFCSGRTEKHTIRGVPFKKIMAAIGLFALGCTGVARCIYSDHGYEAFPLNSVLFYFSLVYIVPYLAVMFFAQCHVWRVAGLQPCVISLVVESPPSQFNAGKSAAES